MREYHNVQIGCTRLVCGVQPLKHKPFGCDDEKNVTTFVHPVKLIILELRLQL